MPITDYKVTDIERDAVRMAGKADPLQGTLAQNQAEFDEYPELIRDNLDGLCDYIATMPISYFSSVAAATSNKGSITGFVPLGGMIKLGMINGNTAASPTVSIDGVTHTISGMPTTAQVQANSTQTYWLVKTGATVLTFTANPDYVCEYGTISGSWTYTRYASGRTQAHGAISVDVTNTATFLTGIYVQNGTGAIASGLFNTTPLEIYTGYGGSSTATASIFGYKINSTSFGVQLLRNINTPATITPSVLCIGTWK